MGRVREGREKGGVKKVEGRGQGEGRGQEGGWGQEGRGEGSRRRREGQGGEGRVKEEEGGVKEEEGMKQTSAALSFELSEIEPSLYLPWNETRDPLMTLP